MLKPTAPAFFLDRLFFLAVGTGLFWVWLLARVPLDDAYIYIRYAENIARGMGPVFNTADPVEGFTGFSWLSLLAAAAVFRLPLDLVSQALSTLSYVGILIVLYAYGRWKHPSSFFAVLPCCFFALSLSNAFWTGFALETMFFSFLTLLTVYLYLRYDKTPWQRVFTGIIACAASLTRPEGLVVYFCLILFETASQCKAGGRLNWPRLLSYAAGLGLYAFFLASRYKFYGYLLPNTFYVKVGFTYEFLQRGTAYLLTFINNNLGGFFVFLAAAAYGLLFRSREREWCLLAFVTGCLFVVAILSGGDWWPFSRHALVAYPLAILLMNDFLQQLFEAAGRLNGPWRLLTRACGWFLIIFIAFTGTNSVLNTTREFPASVFLPNYNRGFFLRAKFYGLLFKKLLPPQRSIALSPMPAVAHFFGGQVFDMLGLTDSTIAHRKLKMGIKTHSHEKGDGKYILSMRPAAIYFRGDLYFLDAPGDYPRMKDLIFISDRELAADPGFFRLYEPYSVKAKDKFVTFFKLREEPFREVPQEEIDALYESITAEKEPWLNERALESIYRATNRLDRSLFFKIYRKIHTMASLTL